MKPSKSGAPKKHVGAIHSILMAAHFFEPQIQNLHGTFSHALSPIGRIQSGDVVIASTLDSRWHHARQADLSSYEGLTELTGRRERDRGHALIGPIGVEDAKPGDLLEIEIGEIQIGHWGWSVCGGWSTPLNAKLEIESPPSSYLIWQIDAEQKEAVNQYGDRVQINPFPGIVGVMPAEKGFHSTIPPRLTGGNLDCALLTTGARLFLPVAVEGAGLSFGDGHAVQGNGEVGGVAIECPFERIELRVRLHKNLDWKRPRAWTAKGERVTFGFDPDLNEAWLQALNDMVSWLMADFGIERRRAISLCSVGADLHITQVANRTCGVHCVWTGAVQISS